MKEIPVSGLFIRPFHAFANDWMALTVKAEEKVNAMTIAWGQIGALWERESHQNRLPVAACYVRPSRYTKALLDKAPYFTLSCFGGEKKKALGYIGSHSGRDGDKLAAAGLTPVDDGDYSYIEGASLVLVCRTIYHAPLIEEGFVDRGLIDFNYPQRDFHEMYTGEIVRVLTAGENN